MRRLSLPIVLASAVVACGGSGSGVSPTPVTPALPRSWSGKVTMSTHAGLVGGQQLVLTTEGTVTWTDLGHDPSLDVNPEVSAAGYTVSSGALTVTYELSGLGCSSHGTGQIRLVGDDGFFALSSVGRYRGQMFGDTRGREVSFPAVVTCGGSSVTRPAEVVDIRGFDMSGDQIDAGHIQGTWTNDDGPSHYTATWDLTPR
jgi:hypothetical protein